MNKTIKKIIFISIFVCLILGFVSVVVNNKSKYRAEYIYDTDGYQIGICFNNENYYLWDEISDDYLDSGKILSSDMYPYIKVDTDNANDNEIVYISDNKISDYLFLSNYFCFFSETYDYNRNFIIENPDWLRYIYVKDGFVFPTVDDNDIDEVWMSLSSEDTGHIKDSVLVNKIVECAKSDGKIELDKETADYIKKHSWDGHCFSLKYAGYPLVEEFHLEETEDGKYTIGQYTAEEYETIYWQDEAHQW